MLNYKISRSASKTAVYVAAIILAFSFAYLRMRSQTARQNSAVESSDVKPFFSLTTNRTYGTNERPKMWVSYQGVDSLDFRVYRVSNPVRFFKQLDDPHQFGDREKTDVAGSYRYRLSILEALRSLKNYLYQSFKSYVREQLNHDVRQQVNQKFHSDEERRQTPLNFSDYARVPLINPNQLVSSWRERLQPTESEYDQRMVSLGRREPGVYLVEAVHNDLRAYAVAIVSDMTMVTKTSRQGDVMVYAVDRKTGAPHAGVSVEVIRGIETLATGSTNGEGIMQTKVAPPPPTPHQDEEQETEPGAERPKGTTYLITASDHDNFAVSDLDSFYFSDYGEGYDPDLTGYIYTDRPVYRPAQKVYFKGIMRRWGAQGYEMVEGNRVKVTIEDPDNGKIFERDLQLSSRGTFSGEVDIPDEAPLGNYNITAKIGDSTATAYFNVEEYKKPEYKVKVTGPKQFASVGEHVKFSVDAKYFFGAPVANADVQYYIYRSRYYRWWWDEEENSSDDTDEGTGNLNEGDDDAESYGGDSNDMVDQGEGHLDSSGHMTVTFEVPEPEEGDEWDYTYRLEAQVTDSSRREMQASAEFVGTRGHTIAEAQPDQYLYFQGDTAKIKVRAGDYLGHPVPASVTLKFIKQEWVKVERDEGYGKYTDYDLHESELFDAEVKTNEQGEAVYEYPLNALGDIYVKAIIHEGAKQITNRGGSFWVADRTNQWADFSYRNGDENSIKLVPDRKSYAPGDTAHVLVMLPVENVHLLVTTELASVLTAREIKTTGRTVVIDVPIEQRFEPDVFLSVAYVRDDEMYSEDHVLSVPARERMLDLQIIPNKAEYKPRETASYTILARNSDGSPAANAEVSFGVVDEAIYSIEPEAAGNIRHEFYGQRSNEVQTNLSNDFTFTGYAGDRPANLARNKPSYQLADFKNSESSEPTVRRDFRDTAFWQPDVITGADGRATVEVALPDNLTTWRATARAVTDDTRVGSAVQKVLARKDLIMRLEMPRFMTEGDTVTISGVVHNFLKSSKVTHVSLEVTGAQLLSPAEETLTIANQGQHRFDWRINAQQAGEVRLLAKALTDSESDAVELTIEVIPHGLRQTMGGSTAITDDNADQTISLDLPAHPDQQARKLRIEAAPSIASTLFGALDYLTAYPYGCTEQTMSQFLPDVIVAQTLQDVQTARIRENNNLNQKVQRGLDRLYSYQHADGGWGWWKNDQTDPFMTAYVVDGLAQAKRAGYVIEEERLTSAHAKLQKLLEENHAEDNNPFDPDARAYMIYALEESGGADSGFIDDAFTNRAQLQPYGLALLALTMKQHGDGRATSVAHEIESSARANDFDAHWESFQKSHWSDYKYTIDVEATALSLKALAEINPENPLLAKAARWLVSNRRNGYYWDTTKQTAFAIYGLTAYLKVSNELSPDYDLEVYVNDERVISRHVNADDLKNAQSIVVERKGVDVGSANRVRVVKHGHGVVYLSTSLEYFTGEDEVQAQSSGDLQITREYMRLRVEEHEDGNPTWKVEPLTGELRSGDLIVSRLHIKGAHAQYMMIEDPIPAGCEQVAYVSGINLNYTEKYWSDWYSAREFRDNRTVLFLDRFDGDATFQYAMRVEIPGQFRVAPARVEQMYQPSVQANTANSRLSILDRR
ncbi:MAG: hypothetical protein AUG51_12070 [Acidobacteria bacterium 13_1_20CM_3_53_8]|nr:MAG: hypothetical protein AUG51_12070 [Acidobacteria bacterium 13_1_20CM_3_53_8]